MKVLRHPGKVCWLVLSCCTWPAAAWAQFGWPVTPFYLSQQITGNFAEFRDTGSADHFHNGTDIPKPDGSPVYPVKDGQVTGLVRTGSNAYVRVEDLAYVHIVPRPSLGLGDAVIAGQTILGTIVSGQGHVHFTNGYVGAERNSLLSGSGLTPFLDTWPPIIRYVRFYRNGSQDQFVNGKVSGPVEIAVKVDEQNGPPSSPTSRRNNGVYRIGYKIMLADSSTVIEEPPGGIRFQFDTKPSNGLVHNVFSDNLSSTTSHVYLVTNTLTGDGAWDTRALTPADYVIMAYAGDTRDNADTIYQVIRVTAEDQEPPPAPTLALVSSRPSQLLVSWEVNPNPDLAGYRLEFTYDRVTWRTRLDESKLNSEATDTSFTVNLGRDIYFRLRALDDAAMPNQSPPSDVYGASDVNPDRRILIVDGFDRYGAGSGWQEPWHHMAYVLGSALSANDYGFDTVSNERIVQDEVRLTDYDAVLWLLGDEAADDQTFSVAEQERLMAFLADGGRLFVSGSEIAWDLDQDSNSGASAADEDFLNNYLRLDFVAGDAGSDSVRGAPTTIFAGLELAFGPAPYTGLEPDVVAPAGPGSQACLLYSDGQGAGVQFAGLVPGGSEPARIVILAFPFETITEAGDRNAVMARILDYFFTTTAVAQGPAFPPRSFRLLQNYPNPFNPETRLTYTLPAASHITLEIFNALGRRVRILAQGLRPPGSFEEIWRGLDENRAPVTSGIYFARLTATAASSGAVAPYRKTIPMTIVR